MKIVKIVQLKYKIKVVPDSGEPLFLNPDIVYKFGLRKNDVLSSDKVNEILEEDSFLECKNSAFRLLARRQHSRKEVEQKLVLKGYSHQIAERVAAHLLSNNFLDDKLFAENFIKHKIARKYGFNKIKAQLFEKGIEKTVITHFELLYSQDKKIESSAFALAEKKIESIKRKDSDKLKIRSKLYNYLMMRGFSTDVIKKVIDQIFENNF
ncbi:MAG: hypothetical protein SCALA702_30840 [Melioribacteraceae bacterium]|nr:MAG: hypothetical protein SCALA702_30840 [Melioribacteraceae bacterium]